MNTSNNSKNHRIAALLLATLFAFAVISNASPIPEITVGPDSPIVDGIDHAFVSFPTPLFTGSIEEWVVADTTNPFGSGDLDFIFQVTDSSGSIQSFEADGFYGGEGSPFNAGTTTGYGSVGTEDPSSISPGGDGIQFYFGSGMTVGSSVDLILQTNATGIKGNYLYIYGEDGTGVPYIRGLGPLPEPRFVAVLLGCLFGVALLAHRRFHGHTGRRDGPLV